MSANLRRSRRRSAPAVATVAAVAALALTATACGPEEDNGGSAPSPSVSAPEPDGKHDLNLPDELPKDLPSSLKDLEKWRNGEWKKWDRDEWLRRAKEFINPIIDDLWDPDRMKDADGNDRQVDDDEIDDGESGGDNGTGEDEGVTDPTPARVTAKPVRLPYTKNTAPVGKVFMDTPKGPLVCSGTVVEDPAHPGKSNLVATAGHCVHAGKTGGWFRNVVFVPRYNPKGLSNAQLENAASKDVAPDGVWWAKYAGTTDHWIAEGAKAGGGGASQDFAVMKVRPEDKKSGPSLQEVVGKAAKVNFNTPRVKSISSLTPHGYPAAPPFDGTKMLTCTGKPGRLTIEPSEPTMYRAGCTMTGGSSGGGWLTASGRQLLSVTSIGPVQGGWLAGPRIGKEAKEVFDEIAKK
ncbi:trypsin-like serine peptidase [Streptomyces ovatisporus]|uniref:Trypsin-like serine peptidase n=1 Tax=Streptomyces ovatisporus TaxID=1128682 RepID=A0ABV9AD94_9ACTN